MKRIGLFVAMALYASLIPSLYSQAGDTTAIQQKLNERIKLAGLNGNGEISTAGTVVTLLKSSLQMAATPNSGAPAGADTPPNTYKNGKLSAAMFLWRLNLSILKIDPNTVPVHTAAAGEKFWVVTITVRKGDVQIKLWSDPDSNNISYWTWLVFPLDKKHFPSADEFMSTLGEVLSVEAPQAQGGQQAQGDQPPLFSGMYSNLAPQSTERYIFYPDGSYTKFVGGGQGNGKFTLNGNTLTLTSSKTGSSWQFTINGEYITDSNTHQSYDRKGDAPSASAEAPPPPPPTHYDAVELPPPPPPPAIKTGMTKAQVVAGYGEPQRKAATGVKEIFFYTDMKMKVTFTNGKVSNVE